MPRPVSRRRPDLASSSAARSDCERWPSVDPAERLRRWAALVAVGEAPLPEELQAADLKIVLAEVARLRRERLVRLIARAIARDIQGDGEP